MIYRILWMYIQSYYIIHINIGIILWNIVNDILVIISHIINIIYKSSDSSNSGEVPVACWKKYFEPPTSDRTSSNIFWYIDIWKMFRKKGTLAQLSLPWMEINRASALHLHYIILDYILSTSFCKHPTKQLPETIQQHAETSQQHLLKVFHKFICCTLKNGKTHPIILPQKKKTWVIKCPHWTSPNQNRFLGSTRWLLF
jgi:hypothetical protein